MEELRDYRSWLRRELAERKQRNPRYSLRAFARDAKLSPAFLSEVMRGRKSIEEPRAHRLGTELGWSEAKTRHFATLVRYNNSDNARIKASLENEIADHERHNVEVAELSHDLFRFIADWYHVAILELVHLEDFRPSVDWVAKRLGISVATARAAVARLQRLELLVERDGKWIKPLGNSRTADRPSAAIRSFHLQMLEKARRAIEGHPEPSRKIGGCTMVIDPDKLDEANRRITEFRRDLMAFLESGKRTALFHFSTQLFRLDRETR